MLQGYCICFIALGIMGRLSDTQTLPTFSAPVIDEKCERCPSYCDEMGEKHEPLNCRISTSFPFCCNFGLRLDCCSNESLKITSEVTDGFHCPSGSGATPYGKTVLLVCVPLGLSCFITVVALFIYQRVVKWRQRTRSSDLERRSRRSSNVSCSSRSSRTSVASSQLQQPTDTVSNGNRRQSPVVISASALDDGYREGDDFLLRFLQSVNTVTPDDACYVIPSAVYPPPYTDDTPPPYTDIFPG